MSRLSRGGVEVPWDSRNALIDRIRQLDAATPTVRVGERRNLHGKEGVSGSSPGEGFAKALHKVASL